MEPQLVREKTILAILGIKKEKLGIAKSLGIIQEQGPGYLAEGIRNHYYMNADLKDLCDLLGIAPRTGRDLAKDGTFKKNNLGGYDLKESINNYIELKFGSKEDKLNEISLRRKAERELKEISLQEKQGKLIPKSHVEQFISKMLIKFKEVVLAYPEKLASKTPISQELKQELKEDLIDMLEELEESEL